MADRVQLWRQVQDACMLSAQRQWRRLSTGGSTHTHLHFHYIRQCTHVRSIAMGGVRMHSFGSDAVLDSSVIIRIEEGRGSEV